MITYLGIRYAQNEKLIAPVWRHIKAFIPIIIYPYISLSLTNPVTSNRFPTSRIPSHVCIYIHYIHFILIQGRFSDNGFHMFAFKRSLLFYAKVGHSSIIILFFTQMEMTTGPDVNKCLEEITFLFLYFLERSMLFIGKATLEQLKSARVRIFKLHFT